MLYQFRAAFRVMNYRCCLTCFLRDSVAFAREIVLFVREVLEREVFHIHARNTEFFRLRAQELN